MKRLFSFIIISTLSASIFSMDAPLSSQQDNTYICQRPLEGKRLFRSDIIENIIQKIKPQLKNKKLAWIFENCFPNTLDTTIHFRKSDRKSVV